MSSTLTPDPNRAKLRKLRDDARAVNSRIATLEPNSATFAIARFDPSLAQARRLKLLPRCMKSNSDIEKTLPKRLIPTTAKLDPRFAKDRSDIELPK
jgi:hypothetical protein